MIVGNQNLSDMDCAGGAIPHSPVLSDREIAERLDRETREAELRDPDLGISPLGRAINRMVEMVGVLILLAMTLLIFFNAAGRYLLNSPISWAENIVIALIPWLAMCGLYLSARRGSVIRITFLFDMMPPRMQRAALIATTALSVAALLYLAWYSFQYVDLFGNDVAIIAFGIRSWWFSSSLLIGSIIASAVFALQLFDLLRRTEASRTSTEDAK